MKKLVHLSVAIVAIVIGGGAHAAEAAGDIGRGVDLIVVTATRVAESSLDLPLSVDRVEQHDPIGRLQVNLSESLLGVPGISAQSRQNYAQDIQLSLRGFGARSSFGVRGVRIYADGIPGTMPDGQGQFSHFDLGSADHIEVLRGPFSALYGNSSGGVIALFTEDGKPGNTLQGSAALGSFATRRYALKDSGDTGGVNYLIDAAHFATQGYRDHSAAERNNLNAKLRIALNGGAKLTLVANSLETPFVQDPLGLNSSQLASNPSQAGTNALLYDTRKGVGQEQLGATYEQSVAEHDAVAVSVYAGRRATTQYQAILRSAELISLKNPGGVIDLVRDYWGTDAHLSDTRGFANGVLTTTAGINYDALQEARKGFLNFNGNLLGVEGTLRRDEVNHVYDFDQYLQTLWEPSAKWLMLAGVRNSLVAISTRPVSGVANSVPNRVQYRAVNPVAGLTYRAAANLNFYASYGRGFETPTLNDLAYRSTNASLPGLNIGLKPARSNNSEIGVKIGDERQRLNLALFNIDTHDELAVLANAGGRSVFQNINQTRRQGVELGLEDSSAANSSYGVVKTRLTYTYLDAVNKSSYGTCVALPCIPGVSNTGLVAPGNELPAIPKNSLFASVSWDYAPRGFSATVEVQSRARIYADDRNTAAAGGFWVANLRAGLEQRTGNWRMREAFSVENIANRTYVGSVIVNEGNSRFFEPAPGRVAYIMFNAAHLN